VKVNRVIVIINCLFAAAAIVVALSWPAEPSYKGKRLSQWLDELARRGSVGQAECKEAIKSMGSRAVPFLVRWLEDESASDRMRVDKVLGALPYGVRTSRLAAWLVRKVDEREIQKSMRANAAERALVLLREDIQPALPDLIRVFRRPSQSFGAYRAANVLAGLGKQAFPQVMETISDPRFSNYIAGASVVGQMQDLGEGGAAAVPFLCHHLKHGGTLTMVCVDALGNLAAAPDEAVPALVEVLTNAMEKSDVMLSRKCAEALGKFGGRGGEAVAVLCAALKSPDGITAAEAARALGKIGAHSEIAVPALIEYLSDGTVHRKYAIEGLLGYGEAGRDAIPLLREALQDYDHDTRAVAQEALQRLTQVEVYPPTH